MMPLDTALPNAILTSDDIERELEKPPQLSKSEYLQRITFNIRQNINCLDDDIRMFNLYPILRKGYIGDIVKDAEQILKLCKKLQKETEAE